MKSTNKQATWCGAIAIAIACGIFACEGESLNKPPSTDTDTVVDSESETTPTDTSSDSTQGQNGGSDSTVTADETPPELDDICAITQQYTALSGSGDGQSPAIIKSSATLVAWSYYSQSESTDSRLQTAILHHSTDTDPPPAPTDSVTGGASIRRPSLAVRSGDVAAIWLDGRWDDQCSGNANGCNSDIAFAIFDETGRSKLGADPIRLTMDEPVENRPELVATNDGFVAIWIRRANTNDQLVSMAIDPGGSTSNSVVISEDYVPDLYTPPAAARNGDTIMAIWTSKNQQKLYAKPLNLDGTAADQTQIIDRDLPNRSPDVVPHANGFLAAWTREKANDLEVYTNQLNFKGTPIGEPNRATWTLEDVSAVAMAANEDSYAIAWLSPKKPGLDECVVETGCNDQVFVTQLDGDGTPASEPVAVTSDPNPASSLDLIWDGGGWTIVFEVRRNLRQQIFFGRVGCQEQ